MTAGRFIMGLVIIAIGFLIVWKAEWLLRNFGRIGWAEQHLGTDGGSRLMYRSIGVVIIIAGMMHATDLTENILEWFVNVVFKRQ